MRRKGSTMEFAQGFGCMGKTIRKPSSRMASVVFRRTSEKAKGLRPLTAWLCFGIFRGIENGYRDAVPLSYLSRESVFPPLSPVSGGPGMNHIPGGSGGCLFP